MKIAAASSDGERLSEHFGRSACFVVFTVTDGRITDAQVRSNTAGHHHDGGKDAGSHPPHGACHGHHDEPGHSEAHVRHSHAGLLNLLCDCEAIICGGMGPRAATDLKRHGIKPVIAAAPLSAREVVEAYLAGTLQTTGATCSHHRH